MSLRNLAWATVSRNVVPTMSRGNLRSLLSYPYVNATENRRRVITNQLNARNRLNEFRRQRNNLTRQVKYRRETGQPRNNKLANKLYFIEKELFGQRRANMMRQKRNR
jgi:hypothetical protein